MRVDWIAFDETLSAWELSLEKDATAVDDARAELKSLDETWKATLTDEIRRSGAGGARREDRRSSS